VRAPRGARAGFTLAEVAVTLLIVAIGMTLIIQGLTTAKHTAADTYFRKLSREMALLTLGQVESGLFWEELDGAGGGGDLVTGNYAEEGHEELHFELVFGEEEFTDAAGRYDDTGSAYHDTWDYEREREDRLDDDDDEDEEITEPFEKVRIKVTYPKFGERQNTLTLERWIAWEQVYGVEEEEKAAEGGPGGEQGGTE
jgi:prepilin-type N-terminal cleavage/methylation domain-containing protein